MIIAFSGTDGAGKSTQIRLLSDQLKKKGYKLRIVWSRGGYTPLFSFMKKVLRILLPNSIPQAGPSKARREAFKNQTVSKIWLIIAILDLFLLYGVYIRALSLLGFAVVCDRYLKDTEIDFVRNFPNTFNPKSFLWRVLVWFAPNPKLSFLLHVPVDVSLARSREKGEPFPDSIETLEFRLSSYLNEETFPLGKYCRVDCQKSVEDVQAKIMRELRSQI